jgi:hypothetical protein
MAPEGETNPTNGYFQQRITNGGLTSKVIIDLAIAKRIVLTQLVQTVSDSSNHYFSQCENQVSNSKNCRTERRCEPVC